MKRYLSILIICFSTASLSAQEYSWHSDVMDGFRTGCVNPSKDNVAEAIGYFEKGRYISPNGKVYKKNSAVARTAAAVIAAQPQMARVKDVIAYSPEEMRARYPESALSNWFIDIIMAKTESLAGKEVHVGIGNFGGIRADMPKGAVILDDMLSMFPFKNQLVYLEMKGSAIRGILEKMAAGRFEVLGGVRVVAEDGKLVSALIDGEPIDDDKIYGVASISFLLRGGDGLALEYDSISLQSLEVDIIDAVLEHVYAQTAAGLPLSAKMDGRVQIKK